MTLDASGNLGVGTTTPASFGKLAVAGNISSTTNGTYFLDGTTAGNPANPTYSWLIDADTGVYRPEANTVGFSTAGSERMRINSSGNVGIGITSPTCVLDVVGGIKTSRTAETSPATTDGNVFSGTYTPTLTNTTNIAASTASVCQYMRVGNVVTVSGTVAIDPTAIGQIVLGMTLPIASALTAATQCGGTFAGSGVTTINLGSIVADATNDRATFDGVVADIANRTYGFTFTYQVL
jgi:enamine deaminase RidA (YjgF/YER057c/UK114 family)